MSNNRAPYILTIPFRCPEGVPGAITQYTADVPFDMRLLQISTSLLPESLIRLYVDVQHITQGWVTVAALEKLRFDFFLAERMRIGVEVMSKGEKDGDMALLCERFD